MAGQTPDSRSGRGEVDIHMSKGDGEDSYSKNSNVQKRLIEKAVIPELSEALGHLHLAEGENQVVLADLGCSSGPNSILLVSQIVQKIKERLASSQQPLEFQAFFNDLPSNDFNNLFQLLSSGDVKRADFFPAGLPGSFFGPLFPESTVHVFVSAFAVHYLSKIPASAFDRESPAFNGGTWWATGSKFNEEAENAFREQYAEDLDKFLSLRAKELVPGGLLCFAICSRWNPESNAEETSMNTCFKCTETALRRLIGRGVVGEDKTHDFNVPIYFPGTAELEELIRKRDSTFEMIAFKELRVKPFVDGSGGSRASEEQEAVRSALDMTRGALTDMLHRHIGVDATRSLFEEQEKEATANAKGLAGDTAVAFVALKKRLN